MLAQLITFFTRVFGRSGSASTHENTAQSEPVSTHSPHLSSQTALTQFLSSLKEHHASASTIKNYASDISQFLTSQPETPLTKLFSTASLDAFFQNQVDKGLKDSSIQRKLASIRQFARWLEGQGHLSKSQLSDSLLADPPASPSVSSSPAAVSKFFWFTGQKKNSLILSRTARGASLSWLNALQLFALLVFCAFLALFGYRQFFSDATPSQAFPDAPVRPSRILSFQGRLTDTARNPITTAANVTFRLFNQSSAGTELWSSGICSIDPDQDGIFTTILGSSCGTELSAEVFSENSQVWLEITVGSETLTPRQRIATVAYALNTETLQGFPINATQSATRNTVAVMNEYGEILLGEINPKISAVGGAFTLEGQSLTLQTAPGTDGNITLAPDGEGNTIIASDLDISGYATVSASLSVGTLSTPSGSGNAVFSGSVGIGTASPSQPLDVSGAIRLGGAGVNNVLNTSAAAGAPTGPLYWGDGELLTSVSLGSYGVSSVTGTTNQISASPTTGNVVLSLPSDLRAPGTLSAVTSIGTGAGAGTVRIDASGNLTNIGTISASGTITASSLSTGGLIKSAAGTGVLSVATGGTDYEVPLTFTNGLTRTSNTVTLGGTLSTDTNIALGSNDFTLSGTGNVGIGTTNPQYQLQVGTTTNLPNEGSPMAFFTGSGVTRLGINSDANNSGFGLYESGTLRYSVASYNGGSFTVYDDVANTSRLFISSAGNVGIGDTTPAALFTVGNGDLFQVNSSGAIAAATGITSSGTITFSGLTDGFVKSTSGVLSGGNSISLTSDITGILPIANGGTNSTATPTNGGIAYGTGTAYAFTAAGTNNDCLLSNGAGAPTWGSCSTVVAGSIPWQVVDGTAQLKNTSLDMLVGGTASSSAKFAFLNVDSGTPTASISGSTAGNALSLTGDGTIQTSLNRSLILNPNGGNVGIGTTSPAAKLHIVDGAYNLLRSKLVSNNGLLNISNTANFGLSIWSNGNTPHIGAYQTILFGRIATSWDQGALSTTTMTLDVLNERVGIGTTTPTALLDIAGTASSSGTLAFRGTTDPKIDILNGETLGIRTSVGGNAGLTERMTILNNGNVGIGTTNPTQALDVSGNVRINNGSSNSSLMFVPTVSGITYSLATNFNSNLITLGTTGVGLTLSTGSSGTQLAWAGTVHGIAQSFQSFTVHDGGPGMRLNTTGLGIGTTTPSQKLDVSGAIRLGATGANNVLHTTAAGGAASGPLYWGNDELLTSVSLGSYGVSSVTGTTNQIESSPTSGAVVLSLPSDLRAPGTLSAATSIATGVGAGTVRIDASGNLTNIGTLTASGTITATSLNAGGLIKSAASTGILSVASAGTDYELPLSFSSGLTRTSNTVTLGGTLSTDTNIALGSNDFTLSGTGNVGVGTSSPAVKFQVNGDSAFGNAVTATNATRPLNLIATDAKFRILRISPNSVTEPPSFEIMHRTSADGTDSFWWEFYGDTNGFKLRDRMGTPTDRFTVSSTGNVGIGDTSPAALFTVGNGDLFQVNSSGAIAAATGITSSGTITFSGLNTAGGVVYTNGSGVLATSASGSTGQCLVSGGTGAPTWASCGGSSSSNWTIGSGVIAPNNSTLDLAIGGTSTASAKFHVNANTGDIQAAGNVNISMNGSSVAGNSPKLLKFNNFSADEAARIEFGNDTTGIQNGYDTTMDIYGYHAIRLAGARNVGSALPFATLSNVGVQILNTLTASEALQIRGASGQTAALTNWVNSSGSSLAGIGADGSFSTGSTITATGSIIPNGGINRTANTLALSTTTSGDITLTPAVSAGLVNVLTGNLKVGNGAPSIASMNGEDAYIEGELEVDGTAYFDNGVITSSIDSLTGAVQISADDNVTINMTTNPSTSLLHVLGGSIKIGDGTPTLSLNGEDLYVEGTAEVDGAVRLDSTVTLSTLNTAGGIVYTNSSGQLLTSAQGTAGQCLLSGAAGAPTWGACGTSNGSKWDITDGVITPANQTVDFAIGGTSTASAKFHVNAVTGEITTSNAAIILNSDLQVKGGDVLGNLGETRLTIDDTTDKTLVSGSMDITAILRSGSSYQFQVDASGNISTSGTLSITGATTLSSLNTAGGIVYTNSSGQLLTSAQGTAGQCLLSGAAGAPTWGACDGASAAYWQLANTNSLSPGNSSFDLLVGGSATSSASIVLTSQGAAVFNEQSRDVDFRIESDTNANAFFVDASTNRIGIGTNAPTGYFEIASSGEDRNALLVRAANVYNQAAFSLADLPPSNTVGDGKAFEFKVGGEGYGRGIFYSDGSYGIGSGSGLRDVYINRSTANTIKISSDRASGGGDLVVTDQVAIGATAVTSGVRLAVTGVTSLAGNATIGVAGGGNTHTMNGVFSFDDGSASTPSIRFDSVNSGFFRNPTDGSGYRIAVSINGTETVQFANPGLRLMPETADGASCGADTEGLIVYDRDSGANGWQYLCRQNGANSFVWIRYDTASANSPDLAESTRVDDQSIEAGDLVAISTEEISSGSIYYRFSATKATAAHSGAGMLGVISTDPGILLGTQSIQKIGDPVTDPSMRPLTLAGRVPVKVVTNGRISKGDRIGSSDLPGVGAPMKKSGYSIGASLTSFDSAAATCQNVNSVEEINWSTNDADFDKCYRLPDGRVTRKIMVMVNNEYFHANLQIADNGELVSTLAIQSVSTESGSTYQVVDTASQTLITQVSTFAELITARLRSGLIHTQELIASIGSFTTSVQTPTLNTQLISPLTDEDSLIVQIGNDTSSTGEFVVRNSEQEPVFRVDTNGTATVSGELHSTSVRVQQLEARLAQLSQLEVETATVSGAFYLSDGRTIESILADNAQFLATQSASPSAVTATSYDDFLTQLTGTADASVATLLTTLKTEKDIDLTAPESVVLNADGIFIHSYLGVSGQTDLYTVSVAGTMSIGNNLQLAHNTISSLGETLEIQPTGVGKISLLAGLMELNDEGQVIVTGDLTVRGTLAANTLSTNTIAPSTIGQDISIQLATTSAVLGESTTSQLTVVGDNQQPVAAITSSGSARFSQLITRGVVVEEDEDEKNSSAGQRILPAGESEITIENNLVTSDSLIYITPTSDTNNQVVFVKSQQTCETAAENCQKGFTVGVANPVATPITFNFWIVRTQSSQ